MEVLKLCFVLLLPMHLHSKETLNATAGKEYLTEICANNTQHIITVKCKIILERSPGAGCRLSYRHGRDFERECDSRFTLMTENQAVYLRLRNLTQADRGSYNCTCSYINKKHVSRHGITVQEDVIPSAGKRNHGAVTGVLFILVAFVILGFIFRRRCHSMLGLLAPGLFVNQTPASLDQVDQDDTYASLQQPADDLYQSLTSIHLQHDTKANPEHDIHFYYQDTEIYENAYLGVDHGR